MESISRGERVECVEILAAKNAKVAKGFNAEKLRRGEAEGDVPGYRAGFRARVPWPRALRVRLCARRKMRWWGELSERAAWEGQRPRCPFPGRSQFRKTTMRKSCKTTVRNCREILQDFADFAFFAAKASMLSVSSVVAITSVPPCLCVR